MVFKKCMVFFLLVMFLTARVEPVFPYLKSLPQLAHNLISSLTCLYSGSASINVLAGIKIDDQEDTDSKTDDKESEKEAAKSFKEECKMLLYDNVLAITLHTSSNRTRFHLYLFGKQRIHVNEVFRPPLV